MCKTADMEKTDLKTLKYCVHQIIAQLYLENMLYNEKVFKTSAQMGILPE